jgi:hypothetical protein
VTVGATAADYTFTYDLNLDLAKNIVCLDDNSLLTGSKLLMRAKAVVKKAAMGASQ